MIGNTEIAMDSAGNIKPNKGANKGKNKIVGVAALVNALAAHMMAPEEYEVKIELI